MGKQNRTLPTEIMEKVIGDLYKTQSVTQTLKDHDVKPQEFYQTLKTYPLLAEMYSRAQDARADLFADEIIHIADNEVDHNKARNRINARMWTTAKMKPSVYGDRLDLNVNQNIDIRGALDEAKNRIRDIIQIPSAQLVESITTNRIAPPGSKPGEDVNADKNAPTLVNIDDLLK